MNISYIVLFTITLLFALAFLDKNIEVIKILAVLTSNLCSGYLGYLMKSLKN